MIRDFWEYCKPETFTILLQQLLQQSHMINQFDEKTAFTHKTVLQKISCANNWSLWIKDTLGRG